MTSKEALKIVTSFNDVTNKPSSEEEFMYIEALKFLIAEDHDPKAMMTLGGYYYEQRLFDLALKYYEMASAMDFEPAYECLGYIWYYGRTGLKDYKKAFEYFSKAEDKGNLVAAYKLADMYKNGFYVEKNIEKYEELIELFYYRVRVDLEPFAPVPEIFTRFAAIKVKQGQIDDAIDLYIRAKEHLAERIQGNPFFGNFNIMKWLIDDLYNIMEFDETYFDFYDLYYLLKSPHKIRFFYEEQSIIVESVMEGEECTVNCNGKWYHDRDDFFRNSEIEGTRLSFVYYDLYDFEVLQ